MGVASIDMVRITIKVASVESGSAFMERISRCCDHLPNVDKTIYDKAGGMYRDVVTWVSGAIADRDKASVAVGMGLRAGRNNKPTTGYVEFNPNKCAGTDMLTIVLGVCREFSTNAWVTRYDLAVDNEVPRANVYLIPDRRIATTVADVSVTQYLGRRSHAGYVKVYDKAAEQGLPGSVYLTRCELTCDGAWNADKLVKQWPLVIQLSADVEPGRLGSALALSLIINHHAGYDTTPILESLDGRTKKSVVAAMDSGTHIAIDHQVAEFAIAESYAWVTEVCPGATIIAA